MGAHSLAGPMKILFLICCVLAGIAASLIVMTLILLAFEGHPEGLLAAAAGAAIGYGEPLLFARVLGCSGTRYHHQRGQRP